MNDPRNRIRGKGVFIHQISQPLADSASIIVGRRQQLLRSKHAIVAGDNQIGERAADVYTDPVFDHSRLPNGLSRGQNNFKSR